MKPCSWIIAIFIFFGCADKNPDKKIIPEVKMSRVLWDMIEVDELATSRLLKDTTKNPKKERIKLYQKVFNLHDITEKQFSNSFAYYSSHPDMMKVLFDTLEARGARERKISLLPKDSLKK